MMSLSLVMFQKNHKRILLSVDICTFRGVALGPLKIQLSIQKTEFLRKSQIAKLVRQHPWTWTRECRVWRTNMKRTLNFKGDLHLSLIYRHHKQIVTGCLATCLRVCKTRIIFPYLILQDRGYQQYHQAPNHYHFFYQNHHAKGKPYAIECFSKLNITQIQKELK